MTPDPDDALANALAHGAEVNGHAGRLYRVLLGGRCLGQWIPPGSELIVDPDQPVRTLDIVSVVLRQNDGPWEDLLNAAGGGFVGVAKYFLGTFEAAAGTALVLGQLRPACAAVVPAVAVQAMHKVVAAPGVLPLTDEDREGFSLIQPFCIESSIDPINPTWRADPERLAA